MSLSAFTTMLQLGIISYAGRYDHNKGERGWIEPATAGTGRAA